MARRFGRVPFLRSKPRIVGSVGCAAILKCRSATPPIVAVMRRCRARPNCCSRAAATCRWREPHAPARFRSPKSYDYFLARPHHAFDSAEGRRAPPRADDVSDTFCFECCEPRDQRLAIHDGHNLHENPVRGNINLARPIWLLAVGNGLWPRIRLNSCVLNHEWLSFLNYE